MGEILEPMAVDRADYILYGFSEIFKGQSIFGVAIGSLVMIKGAYRDIKIE